MKRLFLLAFICFVSLTVVSQVKYGLKAGTTFSWYESSADDGLVVDYNMLAGFQAGVFAEAAINNYFSLQPELLFSTLGAKAEVYGEIPVPTPTGYTTVSFKLSDTMTPLYLDLPLYLKAGFPSVGSDRFTIGAGPMFSYGIGGKDKMTGTIGTEKVSGEIKIFSKDAIVIKDGSGRTIFEDDSSSALLKRFDVSVAAFAAYEINKRVVVSLNYRYGLKNISEEPDEDLWNRSLAISLGYRF
ncbi:outer membrane beta-barrel protein [Gaoshiqia sp. Z1-71]|uniref:outer membrane beta-barrel protein n=1 Tax=Gaoshiqia hydrogeniformans TaxID=3290090 RepID=UPI003BF8769C